MNFSDSLVNDGAYTNVISFADSVQKESQPLVSAETAPRVSSMALAAGLSDDEEKTSYELQTTGPQPLNTRANIQQMTKLKQERGAFFEEWLNDPHNAGYEKAVTERQRRIDFRSDNLDADTGAVEQAFVDSSAGSNLTGTAARYASRVLWMQKKLSEAQASFSEQSLLEKGLDVTSMVAQSVVPFYQGASMADDLEGADSWWLSDNSEGIFNRLVDMSDEEFDEAAVKFDKDLEASGSLFGVNNLNKMIAWQGILSNGSTREMDDAFAVFDAVTLGAGTALDITRAMGKASSLRQTQEVLGKTRGKIPLNPNNPEELLPTGAVPNGANSPTNGAVSIKPTGAIAEALELDSVKAYLDLQRGESLSVEAREAARSATLSDLTSSIGEIKKVRDRITNTFVTQTPTGQDIQSILVGKGNSQGYTTAKGARRAGERIGRREFDVIQDPSNSEWFLKFDKAVSERGFADDMADVGAENGTSVAGRWLAGANTTGNSTIIGVNKQALGAAARFGNEIGNRLQKAVTQLPKPEKQALETTLAKLRDEASLDEGGRLTWYDKSEFLREFRAAGGREKQSDRGWEAYVAAKEANDLDFFVRNEVEYRRIVDNGFEELSIPGLVDNSLAKVITKPSPDDIQTGRVFDHETGLIVREPITDLDKATVYRLRNPIDTPQGPVNIVVSRSGKTKPPSYQQLGYRPGGHRIYEGQFFVKQGRKFTDEGKSYNLPPLTHIAAMTPARAKKWAEEMNTVLDLAKNWEKNGFTKTEADDFIEATSPVGGLTSVDDVLKAIEEKAISDTPFEVVKNGDPLVRPQPGDINLFDESQNLSSSYIETGNRGLNGTRAKFLRDEQDELAQVLSPIETLERAFSSVVRQGVFYNYQTRAIDSWVNAVKQNDMVSVASARNLEGASNWEIFQKAELDLNGVNKSAANALSTQRDIIKRQVNAMDRVTEYFALQRQRAVDWALDKERSIVGRPMKKLLDITKDPIGTMKGLAFDAYLGMLNIDQLFIQTQTLVAVSTLAGPKIASQSSILFPAMFSTKGGFNPDFIRKYANATKLAHGMDPEEVVKMAEQMRKSGWDIVDSNITFLDNNPVYSISGGVGGGVRSAREKARYFFYLAERINRTHAYSSAWMRFKTRNPGIDPLSDYGKRAILDDADRLAMAMTTASQSSWQKGPLSAATQFQGYAARLVETMLPAMFGGTKHFTPMEKLRLTAGQVLMYGTGGIVFGQLVADQIFEDEDFEDKAKYEQYLLLTRGLEDAVIRHVTGIESDVSARAGLGIQMHNMYKDLREQGLLEAISGPPGSTGTNFVKSVNNMLTVSAASRGDLDVTSEQFWNVVRTIKSIDNATKAYMAWNSGHYLSKTGRYHGGDLEKKELIGLQFGIGPSDQREISELMADTKKKSAHVKRIQALVDEQLHKAIQSQKEGDEELFQTRLTTISALVQGLPIDDRARIDLDVEQHSLLIELLTNDWRRTGSEKSLTILQDRLQDKEE